MPRSSACPHCGKRPEEDPAVEAVWPVKMDLTKVTGDYGQMAWRQAVIRNRIAGAVSPEDAKIIAGLVDGAARAKVPTAGPGDRGGTENKLSQIEAQLWKQAGGHDDGES